MKFKQLRSCITAAAGLALIDTTMTACTQTQTPTTWRPSEIELVK